MGIKLDPKTIINLDPETILKRVPLAPVEPASPAGAAGRDPKLKVRKPVCTLCFKIVPVAVRVDGEIQCGYGYRRKCLNTQSRRVVTCIACQQPVRALVTSWLMLSPAARVEAGGILGRGLYYCIDNYECQRIGRQLVART